MDCCHLPVTLFVGEVILGLRDCLTAVNMRFCWRVNDFFAAQKPKGALGWYRHDLKTLSKEGAKKKKRKERCEYFNSSLQIVYLGAVRGEN